MSLEVAIGIGSTVVGFLLAAALVYDSVRRNG